MMIGQGRPKTSRRQFALGASGVVRWGCRVALAVCLLLGTVEILTAETMRIRIEWGGGAARLWEGTVAVRQGTLSEPCPLGIEADEPGSIWLKDNLLVVRQRSPRTYDGVDVLVTAALDEQLLIQLAPAGAGSQASPIRVPLANLLGELHSAELDNQGNRLLVRRTPGDKLQVRVRHPSLVFSPGEVLKLELQPHLLPLAAGSKVRITVQLVEGRGSNVFWTKEEVAQVGHTVAVPLEVPLPNQEGVYELTIAAAPAGWQQAVRAPLGAKPAAERKVQLLVLSPKAPTAPAPSAQELSRVVEIDPANPRWWEERLAKLPQLPALARLRKGPLGNGNLQVRQHPLGPLAELSPSRQSTDLSWEAYWLSINRPGLPHVLEVDYPSDVPQTLGISIMEPNAAGASAPIGLDAGVDLADQLTADGVPPHWVRHRLIFWPRTRTPMVLISNCDDRLPALYGKIRVLGGWEQLPRAFPPDARQPERLLAAYLDRPLFPENFSASESLDAWSGRSLDDWVTFYEGGTRLVEYLNHVGFTGLMVSVLADGSTIYPSELLQPTPRYDTGVFFDSGQDPLRKDLLEMLLRLFDREHLQLIPALEFAAPLVRLEEILRRGGSESEGIQWVGPDGTTWCQVNPTRRGLAPYYNVLEPRVQEAMLAVVRELVGSYAHHPSFAALAIQLSGDSYAQLPGPEWGLDDATIGRFERDNKLKVPGEGANRFAERAKFLSGEQQRRAWLQWRADALAQFYRRVHAELLAVRPGSRLYLAGASMLAGPQMQYELRPVLPRKATFADALLQAGIDPRHYPEDQGVVLLRSEQIAPLRRLNAQAVNLEIQQMRDMGRSLHEVSAPGSLFFHQPQEARLASFDEKSPFRPSYTELVSQLVPSDRQNRRRFVHSLAVLDPRMIFDGGWLLPLGQEDAIRDLVGVYRRLPAVRLERVAEQAGPESFQPVTIRCGSCAGRTCAYVVNDAPFPAAVRVRVEAPAGCRLEELTGSRPVAPLRHDDQGTYWALDLEPYDLVAVWFSDPGVRFSRPVVTPGRQVEADLATQIRDLSARRARLDNPPPLVVLRNPGFELPPAADGQIPGWLAPKQPGVRLQLDKHLPQDRLQISDDRLRTWLEKRAGAQSLRLSSSGSPARLASEAFAAPATGRLSMSAWMRVADASRQPPMRLALEGKLDGCEYYRFAPIGMPSQGAATAVPIAAQWAQYIFQIDDLPLEGLSQVRVRFELMGPGEVWIDDVQLFDLAFNDKELVELSKLIALADAKLQNGQLGDCMRLLEGYWPRFLKLNVPPAPGSVIPEHLADKTEASKKPAAEPEARAKDRSGFLEKVKGALPKPLRF